MANRLRNCFFAVLRAAGVFALCAAMLWAYFALEQIAPAQDAKILFAGTQDDADCAILLSRDACVVIDTGEEQDAEHILSLLSREGVTKIDCLILTHPDKDHIGGASKILDELPAGLVLLPYYDRSNSRYENLQKELLESSAPTLTLSRSREFTFGELSVRVWPPREAHYQKDNDYSLAVLAKHGEVRMFFAGDAQESRISEILEYRLPEVDLYKVPWHGRDLPEGTALFRQLRPGFAVVTAGKPGEMTAQALDAVGAQTVCTVGSDAVFQSDGKKLTHISPERSENTNIS